jgi:hypothetical protein
LVQFFRVLFEYQNVKNRIKFEQERDEAEAVAAKENEELTKQKERAALEEEIRAQLRAEMLAEMAAKGEIPNSGADSSENTSDNA